MTSSADNCDVVAQPHSKTTSTGNVIQQRDSELASSENNRQVDLGKIFFSKFAWGLENW